MARDLLAAGRVQYKNCMLGIVDPYHETEATSSTCSDTQVTVEPDLLDTVQVSGITIRQAAWSFYIHLYLYSPLLNTIHHRIQYMLRRLISCLIIIIIQN